MALPVCPEGQTDVTEDYPPKDGLEALIFFSFEFPIISVNAGAEMVGRLL